MSVPKLQVVDVDTDEKVEISLFHGGSEPVQYLLDVVGERFAARLGKDDVIVSSVMVGNSLVKSDHWTKPVDFFKLDGVIWAVKLTVLEIKDTAKRTVYVRKLDSSKTFAVDVKPLDPISFLKLKVKENKKIDPINQRLFYNKKDISVSDGKTVEQIGLPHGCTIDLRGTIVGGKDIGTFGQCFEFADVSKNSSVQVLDFCESAPEWRVAHPGLSLEGPCKNSQCAAYQKSFVICNFQLKQEGFEMCEVAATCRCPLCKSKIEPVTMGFNNCKYRWEGEKYVETMNGTDKPFLRVRSKEAYEWDVAESKYYRFNPETSGTAKWKALKVWTKEKNDDRSNCISCHELESNTQLKKLGCGHNIHNKCFNRRQMRKTITCMLCPVMI